MQYDRETHDTRRLALLTDIGNSSNSLIGHLYRLLQGMEAAWCFRELHLPYSADLQWIPPATSSSLADRAAFYGPCAQMASTAVVSAEDPTKVAWVADEASGKYIRTSWTKFLRKFVRQGFTIPDHVIEQLQAQMATRFDGSRWGFELVDGYDIVDVYDDEDYGDSCMSHTDMVKLYAENQGVVSLLKILKRGVPYGRALVWKTDQEKTLLDRIYPTDGGSHMMAAINYAASKGWVYTGSTRDTELTVTLKDVEYYPYCDTFHWVKSLPDKDGNFVLTNQNTSSYDGLAMADTDGSCPWWGRDDADLYDEDEIVATSMEGDPLTAADIDSPNYLYLANEGRYAQRANVVTVVNRPSYLVFYRHSPNIATTVGLATTGYFDTNGPAYAWEDSDITYARVTLGQHAGEWSNDYLVDPETGDIIDMCCRWCRPQVSDGAVQEWITKTDWNLDILYAERRFVKNGADEAAEQPQPMIGELNEPSTAPSL